MRSLVALQHQCQQLVSCLHPDNMYFLAELITNATVQVRRKGTGKGRGREINIQ
jgi:hypothetical protein